MGRGLSQLQRDILDALPWLTEDMKCSDAPTRVELVDMLRLDFTPSNRVAVTRAVTRLQSRELILHVYGFHKGRQRVGYAKASEEQVEAFNQQRAAFLASARP